MNFQASLENMCNLTCSGCMHWILEVLHLEDVLAGAVAFTFLWHCFCRTRKKRPGNAKQESGGTLCAATWLQCKVAKFKSYQVQDIPVYMPMHDLLCMWFSTLGRFVWAVLRWFLFRVSPLERCSFLQFVVIYSARVYWQGQKSFAIAIVCFSSLRCSAFLLMVILMLSLASFPGLYNVFDTHSSFTLFQRPHNFLSQDKDVWLPAWKKWWCTCLRVLNVLISILIQ